MFLARPATAVLFASLCSLPILAQAPPAPAPDDILASLEQVARASVADISHLRIEKWKADGNTKHNAQSDADSIQRNLSSALPELLAKVRSAPQDLNANFRLYRNVDVLYDVFSRFAETAGAFGSREEFDILARDLQTLETARRNLSDRLDRMTSAAQTELNQYRTQVKAAQAAAAAPPPKKIVIDDTEPEKKPAKKKKTAKPSTSSPPTQTSGADTQPK